jgi:hypothetical protein
VATSSSNAYAAAAAMVAREVIEKKDFRWQDLADTLPDAIMAIFKLTGHPIQDPQTGLEFRELNLCRALDYILK